MASHVPKIYFYHLANFMTAILWLNIKWVGNTAKPGRSTMYLLGRLWSFFQGTRHKTFQVTVLNTSRSIFRHCKIKEKCQFFTHPNHLAYLSKFSHWFYHIMIHGGDFKTSQSNEKFLQKSPKFSTTFCLLLRFSVFVPLVLRTFAQWSEQKIFDGKWC